MKRKGGSCQIEEEAHKRTSGHDDDREEKSRKRASNGEEKSSLFSIRRHRASFQMEEEAPKKKPNGHDENLFGNRPSKKKKSDQLKKFQATPTHLEEEIIMDILCSLPVRSLLRFKCVSKLWKSFISDHYFKRMHLTHAKTDQKILVPQTSRYTNDKYNLSCSLSPVDVQRLDFPSFKPLSYKMFILCCFDGLFLLKASDGLNRHLLLWNPSTRESTALPHPEFPLTDNCNFGLGYDTTSDDYKILKIEKNRYNGRRVPCEIFALKTGSWRNIGHPPTGTYVVTHRIFPLKDPSEFVHGAFHWLGWSPGYTVVSFSVSNELYGEISLLERMCSIFPQIGSESCVSVLGGMLCFSSIYYDNGEGTFKLWVMKDYGVKESWTELFTIQETGLYAIRPKYRFGNGEVLFFSRYTIPYCSVFRTSRGPFELWPQTDDILQEGFPYTESLISPKLLT